MRPRAWLYSKRRRFAIGSARTSPKYRPGGETPAFSAGEWVLAAVLLAQDGAESLKLFDAIRA